MRTTLFRSAALGAGALFLSAGLAAGQPAPAKIPDVPPGHPRLYVRPADLDAIRARITRPEFAPTWKKVQESDQPACIAMVYLLTGDKAQGRLAVESGLKNLAAWTGPEDKKTKDGRPFFNAMHTAAMVYDWCYDLLTPEEKKRYIAEFKIFAAEDHKRGYPPKLTSRNPIVGHDCEGWVMTNMIPAGLAIHDEDPEMYNMAVPILLDFMMPPRVFHFAAHEHHQGTHYQGERLIHDIATAWLFRRIGAGDLFPADLAQMPYHLLYCWRPDGKFLKVGDDNDDRGNGYNKRPYVRTVGAYYNDPYLLDFADLEQFQTSIFFEMFDLLFLDADAPRKPIAELPLTRCFGQPMGSMIARTGWKGGADSPDAVVMMNIGNTYFGNHHHRDFGTFQIYYKGPLALTTGIYQGRGSNVVSSDYGTPHWRNYYTQTVAANGLMIFDPATAAKDFGGQRTDVSDHPKTLAEVQSPNYQWGKVTGRAFGPDPVKPAYSYIAGDITNAYLPSKAERVRRSMVTLNTGRPDYPAVFAVYDEVIAADPSFKKAFYLHTIQEPRVEGRTTTIVRDQKSVNGGTYNGQLVVETILPAEMRIDKVGGPGKECWNEATGENYPTGKQFRTGALSPYPELGAWRMEVVPTSPEKRHEFFHVMTVMDKGTAAPTVTPVAAEGFAAAQVLGHIVLFQRDAQPARQGSFEATGNDPVRVFAAGLEPGRWKAKGPAGAAQTFEVTQEGGCAWFDAAPGKWTLEVAK